MTLGSGLVHEAVIRTILSGLYIRCVPTIYLWHSNHGGLLNVNAEDVEQRLARRHPNHDLQIPFT